MPTKNRNDLFKLTKMKRQKRADKSQAFYFGSWRLDDSTWTIKKNITPSGNFDVLAALFGESMIYIFLDFG